MGCIHNKEMDQVSIETNPVSLKESTPETVSLQAKTISIETVKESVPETHSKTILETIKESSEPDFEKCTFDNTTEFSLKDKCVKARVVDIYDGDTMTIVINIFQNYFRFNVRLSEIDTCEMKSKDPEAKSLAFKARSRLFELITNKKLNDDKRKDVRKTLNDSVYLVKILCGEFDKYGRLLGWVFDLNACIDTKESYNHVLVKEKLAYLYKGDTKLTEKEQIQLLQS